MRGGFNVKSMKILLRIVLYYVLGYLLFNCIFVLTQFFTLIILRYSSVNIIEIFINNLFLNLIIYTGIYILIVILNFIYKVRLTNKLNIKLKKIREGSGENEE